MRSRDVNREKCGLYANRAKGSQSEHRLGLEGVVVVARCKLQTSLLDELHVEGLVEVAACPFEVQEK